MCMMLMLQSGVKGGVKKVKEADLYSAFIEVPYTQGAQAWTGSRDLFTFYDPPYIWIG